MPRSTRNVPQIRRAAPLEEAELIEGLFDLYRQLERTVRIQAERTNRADLHVMREVLTKGTLQLEQHRVSSSSLH